MKRTLGALALVLLTAAGAHADITVTRRPGGWTDIVNGRGGLTIVRADGPTVIAERPNGELRWRVTLSEDSLYLRAAADPDDNVVAVAQGHDTGDAYALSAHGARVLGPSFGQNAVGVAWTPGAGFVFYYFTSATSYAVRNDAGCAPCAVTTRETSQGFRDVTPTGVVVLGDDAFTGIVNGRRLWELQTRGGITVGQCDPPAICAAADGRTFTIIPGDGFEPHITITAEGFAAVARTPTGATLAIVTLPYPPADPIVPTPNPVPTPVPVPSPAPSAIPDESATVKAVAAQNAPRMARLRAFAQDCHTDADPACAQVSVLKGEMTRRIAWAVFQHDRRWGLRRKPGGTNAIRPADGVPLSTDVLMWKDDGQIVDVMSDRDAGWGMNPADHQPVDQWVEPLPEADAPSGPGPVSGPQPSVDLSAVLAKLAALENKIDRLNELANVIHSDTGGAVAILTRLESRPVNVTLPPIDFPAYSGTVLGQRLTLRPVK